MFAQEQKVLGKCPNCGGEVVKGKYGAFCKNKCGMNVSRIMGVSLSDEQVESLLDGKKTLLKGLTSKAGKTQRTEKKSPECSLSLSWSFPIRNSQERKNKRRM